jgi:hypothetical protein
MPDSIEGQDEQHPQLPHPDESYYILFIEEMNDEEDEAWTARTGCLCCLEQGAEKWLQGGTMEETIAAMETIRISSHEE